ncbi:MAG: hypothetical protein ACRDS9_15960, partial [Pseudonocardiaceae bacterium]
TALIRALCGAVCIQNAGDSALEGAGKLLAPLGDAERRATARTFSGAPSTVSGQSSKKVRG